MPSHNHYVGKSCFKKSLPIIILLDILVLLLFAYIAMPQMNKELQFMIDFDSGVMDKAILEVRDTSRGSVEQYRIHHGLPKPSPEKSLTSSWYGGFKCKVGTACSKVLNLENRSNYNEYIVIFPDNEVITPAIAFWLNFCEKVKCNGGIYIDASNGEASLCSKDGFFKQFDEKKLDVFSLGRCRFRIKE